jgi:hypothetical protein
MQDKIYGNNIAAKMSELKVHSMAIIIPMNFL